MIIDANVHPTPTGRWFSTPYHAHVGSLLQQLDSASIEKAVLVPFAGVIPNAFTLELATKYADRFIPAVSFNPCAHSLETVKEAFHAEFKGVTAPILKLHNRLHNYDLADSRVMALLKANASRASPFIVFVCGFTYGKAIPCAFSPPQIFHKMAVNFPSTSFVIMHAGGSWVLQLYEALKGCSNVYFDLSYTQTKYMGSSVALDLSYLCQRFDQRLIWGSDFPEVSPSDALQHFDQIAANLSAEKRSNILGKNLQRLLHASN